MTIITISRGSYSRGKEVAEAVAERLGYTCISREVLLEASSQYDIPEIKLIRAIHDAPTILDRLRSQREHYVAYIRSALLNSVCRGNVVYHGLAGHFFLTGISHVLKVRIIADLDQRVAEEARREKIALGEAEALIRKDDEQRRRWAKSLYGVDPWDPQLYDLTVHINTLTVADVVELIVTTASRPSFLPTPSSVRALQDRSLEARVEAALQDERGILLGVKASDGVVVVSVRGTLSSTARTSQEISHLVHDLPGVHEVKVLVEADG